MNLKELRELNTTALNNLNEYRKVKEKGVLLNSSNGDIIKKYYVAKHISAEIEAYNKVFEINAIELANEVKLFLKEKTGKDFVLDVALNKKERAQIKDEFGTKYIEKYNYSLVLKNEEKLDFNSDKLESFETVSIASNQSSAVDSNEDNLSFNKNEAMESFVRKTVNLIGSNPIYIANYNNPTPSPIVQKYEMQDFLPGHFDLDDIINAIILKDTICEQLRELPSRDYQIVVRTMQGETGQRIAVDYGISQPTVHRIFKKFKEGVIRKVG